MILRSWRAWASEAGAAAYETHVRTTVFPTLAALGGRGAWLLRRPAGDEVELRVLSLWDSPVAVRAFAGEDPDRAVVEPAARRVLARFDERVEHFEVVAQT